MRRPELVRRQGLVASETSDPGLPCWSDSSRLGSQGVSTCSNCGAENRPEASFCSSCGSALERLCPNGHPVGAEARFCDRCGVALEAALPASTAVPPQPRETPAAERRLVSVLFADLVGFTTLSESRDSEEGREIPSRYFDSCRRLIELYGGAGEEF